MAGAVSALFAAVTYVVVRCGVGTYPGLAIMLDITAQLPSIPQLAPLAQTFQFSPLGPLLAFGLGIDGAAAYQVLHVVVLIAGAAALTWAIARRWSVDVAVLAGVAFVTSQAAVVTIAWTGSYDVFTLVLVSTVVVTRSRSVAAVAGFVAAFAVFEQVAISLVLLAVVATVTGDEQRGRYVTGLLGAIAGRVVLTVVLAANDVTHDRRYWFELFGYTHFLEQFQRALPLLALTAFGGAWIVVVMCLAAGVSQWRTRAVWIAALLAPLVPTALSEDQTRVYAIVSWPIVLALVTTAGPRLTSARTTVTACVALVLGLVLPPIFLWRGDAFLAEHHLFHLLSG